jgi:two-component system NtrC family sensor kinase
VTVDPTAAQPGDPVSGAIPSGAPSAGSESATLRAWLSGPVHDEIVRQSIDAIVITDAAFEVRVWNPAAERLYGIPADVAIGRPMDELVATFDRGGEPLDHPQARAELAASGGWRRRIVQRPQVGTRTDDELVVDSIVSLLVGPAETPVGALAVNRDMSDSSRLEAELAALGSLVLATGRARTRSEVAQAALEILCRATGAEAGLVTTSDGGYEAAGHIGVQQATIDVIVDYGELGGPLARALEAPGAYVSADVATAPIRDDVRAAVAGDGIEHLIVVGLHLADRLAGILALGWRQQAPREPSRAIMLQAAALVAASMENARLLAVVERGLREEQLLTRRMGALVELTRLPEAAAGGSPGIEWLMRDIGAVIGADGSAYARVDGDRLVLESVDGLDWTRAERLVNRPMASLPMAAALADDQPAALFALDGGAISGEAAAATARAGYRSAAAFAIRDEGALLGVLFSIFRRSVDELDIDERTLAAIGRVLDISFANRRLREGVSASERRYRELFESSPDALIVQSLDNVVVDANEAAVRLHGGELVGRPVAELIADEPGSDAARAAAADGFRRPGGLGRRLDGSTFPEETDVRPIEIDGQPRLLAIVRDLTERTRMQTELIQAQKMDAIGMLVAGVAHELNNPLAAIVGFSHLLRTDPALPPDLRRQADLLVQEANRTRVIVQNLLDFARQRPPERVDVELRPLIDSVLGLQSYVFAQSKITVEVDLPPELPRIWVDRSQIQQVLINLTVNAAQAIRELDRPGAISIRAEALETERGPQVRIAVADDGPGVPPEIVERLFMPFLTTKAPGAGTGLGLSVSFGIVAGHGGTLRYERNAQGGATFSIELPAGPAAADPSQPPPARADAAAGRATGLEGARDVAVTPSLVTRDRRPRVLVLDDEPAIRELLSRVLARHGFEPILADTGELALEVVRTAPPDAILCDHRMAGMSGTEFLAAVVETAPELAERFAFMSGDVLNPELRAFADIHGVQLLAKPFDVVALASFVATLVGQDPEAASALDPLPGPD